MFNPSKAVVTTLAHPTLHTIRWPGPSVSRYGYGYGYILGPSPVPPIYLTGSFGLVRPAWIKYTRSAMPQDVEELTRSTGSPRVIDCGYKHGTGYTFCHTVTPLRTSLGQNFKL